MDHVVASGKIMKGCRQIQKGGLGRPDKITMVAEPMVICQEFPIDAPIRDIIKWFARNYCEGVVSLHLPNETAWEAVAPPEGE